MLDHSFVEWAAKVPTALKLQRGETKAVLKKAMEPYLPKEVLYRPKMGFAVPLDMWFRDSLKDRIAATVKGDRLKDCGYFNPDMLDRMVDDHVSGKRDYTSPLWALLMFDGFLAANH